MTALDTSWTESDRTAARQPGARARCAAGCAALAGVIHLAVAPEHARGWWLSGVFFVFVAVAQFALAWSVLRRPGPIALLIGIWGTLQLIALYVLSRTAGLPFAPAHEQPAGGRLDHLPVAGGIGNGVPIMPTQAGGHAEAVGALDLTALAAELTVVGILVGLLPAGLRRLTTNLVLAAGLGVWTVRAALAVVPS